ncbi:MAG: hypothetical protein ABJ239_03135 [Erythrobacter sp.]
MKRLLTLLVIIAVAGGAWFYFSGTLDRVTETRVDAALTDNGVPPDLANCMSGRMVERLSLNQLRKLERISPQEGEAAVPIGPGQFMDRINRADDAEAIEVTAQAAAACAIGSIFE